MGLTTDPSDPRLGRGTGGEGMNEVYLVLSEEERAKGFVRPVRQSYVHVGREVCGRIIPSEEWGEAEPPPGKKYVCSMEPMHEGECRIWAPADPEALKRLERTGMLGGCGVVTRMGLALSETYAREPSFYGATYCCGCRTHLPVGADGEFVWDVNGAHAGMKADELRDLPRVGT